MTTTSNIIEANKQYYFEVFEDTKGRPCAKMIRNTPKGKRKTKTLYNYYFGTEAGRNEWVSLQKESILKKDSDKKKRSEEKKQAAKEAKVDVGDIFVWSWGWEQTNIDFFQVTERKGQSIVLKQITQTRQDTGWCQGTCLPVKDSFKEGEKPITKRINAHPNGSVYVSTEYGYCHIWDGSAEHWSSYA